MSFCTETFLFANHSTGMHNSLQIMKFLLQIIMIIIEVIFKDQRLAVAAQRNYFTKSVYVCSYAPHE